MATAKRTVNEGAKPVIDTVSAPKEKAPGIRETIMDNYPDNQFTFLEGPGLDSAILGVCNLFGKDPVIAYDEEKVIKSFMKQGMTRDEAREYYEFNTAGAYMGELTPVFINLMKDMMY